MNAFIRLLPSPILTSALVAAICLLPQSQPLEAQSQVQKIAKKFETSFQRSYQQQKFNGVILVGSKAGIVSHKAYGFQTPERTKMNPDAVFNLASVSKQFTALAVMMLAEDGRLKLSDPVSKYLPQIHTPGIQIQHLVYHTSGLPDYMDGMEDFFENDKIQYATNQHLLQYFDQARPANDFALGTRHEYSNTGYVVLASIIEKASGQSYASFLKNRIFQKAGMRHSYVCPATVTQDDPLRAIGFERQGQKLIRYNEEWVDGMVGDGNVCSSAPDLFRYVQALRSGRLLSASKMQQLFTSGRLKNGQKLNYGFGWNTVPSGSWVDHTGSWVAFNTYLGIDLDDDLVFIALDNSDNEDLPDQVESVLDQFYD
ncbi:MAG: beta-lactamase family protein [Leptospiraceae bacterium]|nr:beta-lactamase family protein [Leptospiraceae bacterium]